MRAAPTGALRARTLVGAAACIVCAVAATSCNNTNATTLSSPPTTDPALTLTVQHSPEGPLIATGRGDTLYDFAPDTPTHSTCLNDGCVFQWPPLIESGPVRLGKGIDPRLVGTLRRPDGSTQISYGGHPLYTYALDVTPGMVTGQAIDQDGGLWYVIDPAGTQITTSFSVNAPNSNGNGSA